MVQTGILISIIVLLYLSLFYPKKIYFLMLFFIILWPDYILFKYKNLPGLTPPRILVFVLFISLVINAIFLLDKTRSLRSRILENSKVRYYFFWVILFFTIQFFSSTFASDEIEKSIFASINNIAMGIFPLLFTIYFFNTKEDIEKIIYFIFICAFIVNLVALMELLLDKSLFSDFLITKSEFTLKAASRKLRDGSIRIESVFSNSLIYAQFLLMMIPLGIYLFRKTKNFVRRFFIGIYLLSNYLFIIKTDSRAGIILAVLVPFYFGFINFFLNTRCSIKRNILKYTSLIILILISSWVISNTQKYLDYSVLNPVDQKEGSAINRLRQLKLVTQAISSSPLIGFGVNDGMKHINPLKSLDNYYLTLLLETGVIGLTIFLLMNIQLFGIFVSRHVSQVPEAKYIVLAIGYILTFYLILSLDKMNTLYFVLCGLGISIILNKEKNESNV